MGQFEEMSVFVEIARAEGITSAADRMNVAPSAISRKLKDLETRLGTQLLTRTTRQVSLTEAGRSYLAHAERILADMEEANNDIAQLGSRLAGKIYLAAPLSFGIKHLPAVLSKFMHEHPDIEIDVDMSDRIIDLSAEGFNLALRIGNLQDSSLIARKIVEMPSYLAASPDFIKRYGPFRTIEDLKGLPAVIYTGTTGKADVIVGKPPNGPKLKIPVHAAIKSNNGNLMTSMAAQGHGLVRSPCFILQDALNEGSLIRLFPEHDWGTVTLHAVWPPTRHMTARTRALIDYLTDAFAQLHV